MDQPRVAVVGKDNRLVDTEQRIEFLARQAMRMFLLRLQGHQVYNVDEAHFQIRHQIAQDGDGRKHFQRRHVARSGQHDIRFA